MPEGGGGTCETTAKHPDECALGSGGVGLNIDCPSHYA